MKKADLFSSSILLSLNKCCLPQNKETKIVEIMAMIANLMKLADEVTSVVLVEFVKVSVGMGPGRHVPKNVTLVVKLFGEEPTAYCWKVTTPEELDEPQVLSKA